MILQLTSFKEGNTRKNAKTIYAHFFVAKTIYAHFFCWKIDLRTSSGIFLRVEIWSQKTMLNSKNIFITTKEVLNKIGPT